MARAWYVLSVYSGYENKVEKFIRMMMKNGELAAVLDVNVLTEDVTKRAKNSKGVEKERVVKQKLLPGYVLLEMDIPDRGWKEALANLYRIQGVLGFLGQVENCKPQPVANEEVTAMFQKAGLIKTSKSFAVKQAYVVGEQVRIIDGSLSGYTGRIKEVESEKGGLVVVMSVFGRDTSVEVDFEAVERV